MRENIRYFLMGAKANLQNFYEWFSRRVTCRIFGHDYSQRKLSGFLCKRCRSFQHY